MYLYKDDAEQLTAELKKGLRVALKNVSAQLLDFLKDSDWAMIIKLHAAIEATITQVILAHMEQQVLRSVIERLPLSDNQTGKGKIALDLGVITKGQFTFIRRFSELRNSLVHRVENINFDLGEWYSGLDAQQRKSWKSAIAWQKGIDKQKVLVDMLESNPKLGLFLSVFTIVTVLTCAEQEYLVRSKVDMLSDRTMKELFGDKSDLVDDEV